MVWLLWFVFVEVSDMMLMLYLCSRVVFLLFVSVRYCLFGFVFGFSVSISLFVSCCLVGCGWVI